MATPINVLNPQSGTVSAAQPGSPTSSPDVTEQNFTYFVNTYYQTKNRSGQPWTLAAIIAVEAASGGLDSFTCTLFYNWCASFPAGTTGAQILGMSAIDNTPMLQQMVIVNAPAAIIPPDSTVLGPPLTLGQLWAYLQSKDTAL
jgi:hypothetical protein